jgi:hypothetical protein
LIDCDSTADGVCALEHHLVATSPVARSGEHRQRHIDSGSLYRICAGSHRNANSSWWAINIAHQEIDLGQLARNQKNSGFCPERMADQAHQSRHG